MFSALEKLFSAIYPLPEQVGAMKTEDGITVNVTRMRNPSLMPFFLAMVSVVLLQLLVGKYLWNSFLTRLVPSIQPVAGIVDVLAISILLKLLF
jgi:hypothetical protein